MAAPNAPQAVLTKTEWTEVIPPLRVGLIRKYYLVGVTVISEVGQYGVEIRGGPPGHEKPLGVFIGIGETTMYLPVRLLLRRGSHAEGRLTTSSQGDTARCSVLVYSGIPGWRARKRKEEP